METLTIRQAFDAMSLFLEHWYQLTNSADIGGLLGGLELSWLDPSTGERWTMDPALWGDWMMCVQKILFPDTSENRHLLHELVSNKANYLGEDVWENEWYAELLPDGRQLWAKVRNGEIQYGGIRQTPKAFDPKTGLSSPNNP